MKRHLIYEFKDGPKKGQFRDCTANEIKVAMVEEKERLDIEQAVSDAQHRLKEFNEKHKNCPHPVCYDEDEFPYFVRTCIICGGSSLL